MLLGTLYIQEGVECTRSQEKALGRPWSVMEAYGSIWKYMEVSRKRENSP